MVREELSMRNPLNKRLPRELKHDFGKYLVIFLFMVMMISLVSGFLVADNSVKHSYDEGFEKNNLEDGHFALDKEPDGSLIKDIENKTDSKLYDLRYFEEDEADSGDTIRVYKDRTEVNLECVMEGEMPAADNEIALDRMYAQNEKIKIGDTIKLAGKELKVTGFVAVPDYSCLFENNSDMMFDATNFSIAVMTDKGFENVSSNHVKYNYAWKYNKEVTGDKAEKEASEDFLENLGDIIKEYDTKLIMSGNTDIISVSDYLPRYTNKAINFTGDDMGSDKATIMLFDYIVVVVIAFVFAVTTSNTISQEAGVIGTLRASGYKRSEIVRHYMVLPVVVTLVAAVVGNILGYTLLEKFFVNVYYNSYSLCTYTTLLNAEAFVDTTVVPIIIIFVVNLIVLEKKLRLSPLKFLRHELTNRKRKKLIKLSHKLPFMTRFRLRIMFQNIPNYLTLFLGILIAGALVVFSIMFEPLIDDYADVVKKSQICDYQYVLKSQAETDVSGAEKYCVTSLDTTDEKYMTDDIMIYGIQDNSRYVDVDIKDDEILVSNGVMVKYGLKKGDTFKLKDPYSDNEYEFTIAGSYKYDAALAVFMTRKNFIDTFDKADDYFTGYFTDKKLTDIDDKYVASIVTYEDLIKVSNQMKVSMGEMMYILKYFGIIMFVLLMYLLSKQIIEKNAQSISMTKILGFKNGEIGGLYIVATSIMVVISLVVSVPIVNALLKWAFSSYLYTSMTGYIPYMVRRSCFVEMVILGIVCYAVVAVLQLVKISKIPKTDALKNVE